MDRWQRARKAGWLPGLGGAKTAGPKKSAGPAPAAEPPRPAAPKDTPKTAAPGALGDMLSGLGESIRKKRQDIERKDNGGPDETEVDQTFHALTRGLSLGGRAALPRVLQVALDLAAAEGAKGAAVVDIATELRWSRPTVRARMRVLEVEELPRPERWSTGAKPERGYAREVLQAARERVLSGELEVFRGIDADE